MKMKKSAMLLALICSLAFTACQNKAVSFVPVSEQDAMLFSDSLYRAFAEPDPGIFREFQDEELLMQRIEKVGPMRLETQQFSELYLADFDLAEAFIDPIQGAVWTYVAINRLRKEGDDYLVQMRVHDDTYFYNYYEFLIKQREDGEVSLLSIGDFYNYVLGEWLSEATYRYGELMYQLDQSPEEKRDGMLIAMNDCSLFFESGDFKEGEAAYNKLPAVFKEAKSVQNARLIGAIGQSPEVYQEAKSSLIKLFPQAQDYLSADIEHALFHKDYPAVRKGVAALQEKLGGNDAYLEWLIGHSYHLNQNYEDALVHFVAANEMEPEFRLPLFARFFCLLDLKLYDDAISILRRMEQEGYGLDDFDLREYPGFLESDALTNWMDASDAVATGKEEM
jgi:hypothetical protein